MTNPPPVLSPGAKALRLTGIAAALLAAAAGLAWTAGRFGDGGDTPQAIVDTLEQGKPHAGFRRAHAKGLCVEGRFIGSGALSAYSSAAVFAPGEVPVRGRLSIGGGNPLAPDTAVPVRSMALVFDLPDGRQWRTAMNTPPVLAVSTPEGFHAQLRATAPDPATGKPDPERVAAFFAAHPESAEFRAWQKSQVPSSSFAETRFHSINAFVLVSGQGGRQPVRWAMVPEATVKPLGAGPFGADHLQQEFTARLAAGPARWTMEFTLAEPEDAVHDPARAWPEDRRRVAAGVLELSAASAQAGGACDGLNFDPLVLPEGIERSADPILAARSAAYAESYRRRGYERLTEGTR